MPIRTVGLIVIFNLVASSFVIAVVKIGGAATANVRTNSFWIGCTANALAK